MARRKGKRALFVWKNRPDDTGRTTSRDAETAASAGGCAVAFFVIASIVMLKISVAITYGVLAPTWDVHQRFQETSGEILASRMRETFDQRATYFPEFLIRFTPAGLPAREVWGFEVPERGFSIHANAWEAIDRRPAGTTVRCWYDPADPGRVSLDSGRRTRQLLLLLIPLAILAVGVYGLRQAWRRWGISPEHSARKLDNPEAHHIGLFIGICLVVFGGMILSAILYDTILPELRAATAYVETPSVIVDSRILTLRSESSNHEPEFKIRYQTPAFPDPVEMWCYRATSSGSDKLKPAQQAIERYPIGATFPCWYDPDRPRQVVLDRSIHWQSYFLLAAPALFLIPGVVILYFVVQGLRHRTPDAPDVNLLAFPSAGQMWATPRLSSPQPGRWYSHRLTERGSLWREFWFLLVFTLGWHVVAGVFATMAIVNRLQGKPEWFLTIFSSGLVLLGALMVLGSVRKFFVALRVPAAVLELSAWPLAVGKTCKLHVTQGGQRPLKRLTLDATCEESTTFREGTTSRTETADIYAETLLDRDAGELAGAMPFVTELEWHIPAESMHSFQAKWNSVAWRLKIVGTFANGEKIESEFVVPVRP